MFDDNSASTSLQDYIYSTCHVASGLLQRRAGRSSSFPVGTVPASPTCTRSCTYRSGFQAGSLWLFKGCTGCQSLRGSSTSCALWFSRFWDTRRNGPSDIGCQNSGSIYTTRLIVWQPRRAADTSTNRQQSLFCCYTASMEQAADGAETAAIDELVSSWSKNIFVWFCLQAPGFGINIDSVMCSRSFSRGLGAQMRNTSKDYKCLSYSPSLN